jgi:hypothetical protein
MYNAGTGRVRFQGTPKNTLDYIHRILERQRRIERAFQAEARWETEFRLAKNAENENGGDQNPELFLAEPGGVTAEFAAAKPAWPRFVRLAPLTGWR